MGAILWRSLCPNNPNMTPVQLNKKRKEYDRCGLTKDLYRRKNVWLSRGLLFIWYCLWFVPDLLIVMLEHLSELKKYDNCKKTFSQSQQLGDRPPRSRDLKREIPPDRRCDVTKHQDLLALKGRENWLKMDFESLFDAPKMIPMPGPHKEYHP
ncbi:hypothetical protein CAPTEDRAFT_217826 [Capitella teleta]|uniref:Uncharacterized protein n=1 Tax=Capitella teleta TaxID=283909 RepID=R7TMB6_CAPTE|nr:hypothetical protein CAPTEDRAFT_217826 [Capitella teleta]|eukprot:ELT94988.1 hypothetical protein CAPTEDRAFT_217826 [Capitella teleta]